MLLSTNLSEAQKKFSSSLLFKPPEFGIRINSEECNPLQGYRLAGTFELFMPCDNHEAASRSGKMSMEYLGLEPEFAVESKPFPFPRCDQGVLEGSLELLAQTNAPLASSCAVISLDFKAGAEGLPVEGELVSIWSRKDGGGIRIAEGAKVVQSIRDNGRHRVVLLSEALKDERSVSLLGYPESIEFRTVRPESLDARVCTGRFVEEDRVATIPASLYLYDAYDAVPCKTIVSLNGELFALFEDSISRAPESIKNACRAVATEAGGYNDHMLQACCSSSYARYEPFCSSRKNIKKADQESGLRNLCWVVKRTP